MSSWLARLALASAPVLVGALVTIAWANSHNLTVLTREYDDLRGELSHQRDLVEQQLAKCK